MPQDPPNPRDKNESPDRSIPPSPEPRASARASAGSSSRHPESDPAHTLDFEGDDGIWTFFTFLGCTVAIWFLILLSSPALRPASYPKMRDFAILLLIPLVAFHMAGKCRKQWVFGLFGILSSLPFWLTYLELEFRMWSWGDPPEWVYAARVIVFVIGMGLVARGAGKLRHRLMDRKRNPGICRVCKYDLTGNVSGICPECGTTIEEDGESPSKS